MRRPLAFHPLLLAAFPALALYAANARETPPSQVVWPIVLPVAGVALLVVLLWPALRDHRRAALVATLAALLVLSYGHVRNLLGGEQLSAGWSQVLLAAWGLAAVGAVWWAVRTGAVAGATRFLNAVALALVATSAVSLALAGGGTLLAHAREDGAGGRVEAADGGPTPDVWYLVFDRYAGPGTLEEVYGFDNSLFLDRLREAGFSVAEESYANYQKTAHSLASSLNMTYLDHLAEQVGPASGNWLPLYRIAQEHRVGEFLQGRGYRYVHIGSWYDPFTVSRQADLNLSFDARSEFFRVWLQTTAIPSVLELAGVETESSYRETHFQAAMYQFEVLDRLAREDSAAPTFVFAHVLLPHPPYVVDPEGSWIPGPEEARRGDRRGYVDQVRFVNRRLEELVGILLEGPDAEDPIIILQADEGPFPDRYAADVPGFDWRTATDEELRMKLSILNAYHLPGSGEPEPHPTITPVNSFRLVLSRYFGADLPLLPDRSFVFVDERHLYDFVEVTDRLR